MFRSLQAGPQWRQGLLKVRPGHTLTPLQGTKPSVGTGANQLSSSTSYRQHARSNYQQPGSIAFGAGNEKLQEAVNFINNAKNDPVLQEVINPEFQQKRHYFHSQVAMAHNGPRDAVKFEGFLNASNLMNDPEFRIMLSDSDLNSYFYLINYISSWVRSIRLQGSKNRDSDNYHNKNLIYESKVLEYLSKLIDYTVKGEFNNILSAQAIKNLFYVMNQWNMYELVEIWENGITNEATRPLFMNDEVLAIALQVSYRTGKLTYDEVLTIYERSQELHEYSHKSIIERNGEGESSYPDVAEVIGCHTLLCSIGGISVQAGHYDKGLDILESLLKIYEKTASPKYKVLDSIAQLHLTFIGKCKDITIARHFFDKIIEGKLPYKVRLKTPFVIELLDNAANDASLNFEQVTEFWIRSLRYVKSNAVRDQSRYSNINNAFFRLFFQKHSQLTPESLKELRRVISLYHSDIRLDEIFLNTVISNYNWGDKEVLEYLISYYKVFDIKRTPVSFRIVLKKCGEVEDYTNQEILAKWEKHLKFLDSIKYKYIPIADWAAIRDATILSSFSDKRTDLYLAILDKFKNFIQDYRTCERFCKHWKKQNEHYQDFLKVVLGKGPIKCDTELSYMRFQNLTSHIDFKKCAMAILRLNE